MTSFTISREFNAPLSSLWKAWTVPELMAKWWGPKGMAVGKYTMDFREGGSYLYSMIVPGGAVMWGKFNYQKILSEQKMVFLNHFSDENGGITQHPFSPTWPKQLLSIITFSESAGKSKVTIEWQPINPTPEELETFTQGMESMQQGWGGTLDQLSAFLESHS